MGQGHGGDTYIFTHYDGAGAFVDDDLGAGVGLHLNILQPGDKLDDAPHVASGHNDIDGAGVAGHGQLGIGFVDAVVDGLGDAVGGGEVGIAQGQLQLALPIEGKRHLTLHGGSARDAGHGGMVLLHPLPGPGGGKSANGGRSLGHGIDFTISTLEGRLDQGTALKALGIPQRGEGDIDAATLAGEGLQGGGYHHRGDIFGGDADAGGTDADLFQHGTHRLTGEGGTGIPAAVETHHQTEAGQGVVSHAFNIHHVLETRRMAAAGHDEGHG